MFRRYRNATIILLSILLWCLPASAVQVIPTSSGANTVSGSAQNFLFAMAHHNATVQTAFDNAAQPIPANGWVGGLASLNYSLTDPDNTYTLTIYINGSSTSCTCTFDENGICFSTTYCAVSAGDEIAIASDPVGSPSASQIYTSWNFQGTNKNQTIIMGSSGGGSYAGTLGYEFLQGNLQFNTTTALGAALYIPKAGTIKDFYARSTAGVPLGTRTLTVGLNGSDTSMVVAITSGSQDVHDSSHNFSVAVGDYAYIHMTRSGVSNIGWSWGLVYENDGGEFLIAVNGVDSFPQSGDEYAPVIGSAQTIDGNSGDQIDFPATRIVYTKWYLKIDITGTPSCGIDGAPTRSVAGSFNYYTSNYTYTFGCVPGTPYTDTDLEYSSGYDVDNQDYSGFAFFTLTGYGYTGNYYLRSTLLAHSKQEVILT